MRQSSKRVPHSAEKTVRDIRRATRRHHSAEDKIVSCWKVAVPGLSVPSGDYVVEDHADHVLATFKTEHEAIDWAKKTGTTLTSLASGN